MEVQYYPPYIPPDPAMALEDNLRRAYPAPPDLPPDRLADLLRRLMERAAAQDSRPS